MELRVERRSFGSDDDEAAAAAAAALKTAPRRSFSEASLFDDSDDDGEPPPVGTSISGLAEMLAAQQRNLQVLKSRAHQQRRVCLSMRGRGSREGVLGGRALLGEGEEGGEDGPPANGSDDSATGAGRLSEPFSSPSSSSSSSSSSPTLSSSPGGGGVAKGDERTMNELQRVSMGPNADPLSCLTLARLDADLADSDDDIGPPSSDLSGGPLRLLPTTGDAAGDGVDTHRRSRWLAFNVILDVPDHGKLGMELAELPDGTQVVRSLENKVVGWGVAETAGLRPHDSIIGVDFASLVAPRVRGVRPGERLNVQVLRDPLVTPEMPPAETFPAISRLLAQLSALARSQVTSAEEEQQICSAILALWMAHWDYLSSRAANPSSSPPSPSPLPSLLPPPPPPSPRTKALLVPYDSPLSLSPVRSDIHKLCLGAKGLREAVCIQCLDTYREGDTVVMYRLRVEDVEGGRSWLVSKRYRDFASLQQQLGQLWPPIASFPFPPKHIVKTQVHVIEERVVALEAFLRRCTALLTTLAASDHRAGEALQRIYAFVELPSKLAKSKPALKAAATNRNTGHDGGASAKVPGDSLESRWPLARPSDCKALEIVVFDLLSHAAASASLLPPSVVDEAASNDQGDEGGSHAPAKSKLTLLAARECAALIHTFKVNVLRDPAIVARSSSKAPGAHEEVLKEVSMRISHLTDFVLANYRATMMAVLMRDVPGRGTGGAAALRSARGIAQDLRETLGGGRSSEEDREATRAAQVALESLALDEGDRLLRKAAHRQSEAAIFVPLRRFLMPSVNPLRRRSRRLQKRMEALKHERLKTAAVLQVDPRITTIQPEWRRTLNAFRKLSGIILPCDLIDGLCEASRCVVALHSATGRLHDGAAARGSSSSKSDNPVSAMSADDFLPKFTFCMILAVPEDILTQAEFMSHLIDSEEAVSEKGYYVASLQAAVNIAMTLKISSPPK